MKQPRYGFSPTFESVVVLFAISDEAFYAKIGHALEPDLLVQAPAKLLVQAAHALKVDLGKGPGSTMLVTQRIRRWVEEGKYKVSDLHLVDTYLDEAESLVFDANADPDTILKEALPAVRRRIQQKATETALKDFSKDGDFDDVLDLLGQARGLGVATSIGAGVDLAAAMELIQELKVTDYLELGISELDAELQGGVPRGTETIILGRTGSGKSQFLTHTTAHSLRRGLNVAVATLELPVTVWMSRLAANLTGELEAEIRSGRAAKEAGRKLSKMTDRLGAVRCEHFTAYATTVPDILTWVTHIEKSQGFEIDVLVVDYADKLKATSAKEVNDYNSMRQVYEELRIWAERKKKWILTASAAKAKSKDGGKGARINAEDAADSMHKGRVADVVISINTSDVERQAREVTFFIAKNRLGPAQVAVGPLTCDFAYGRMVM